MLEGMGRERRVCFPPRCHIWCVFDTLSPFSVIAVPLGRIGSPGIPPPSRSAQPGKSRYPWAAAPRGSTERRKVQTGKV